MNRIAPQLSGQSQRLLQQVLDADFQERMQARLDDQAACQPEEYCYPWPELSNLSEDIPVVGFGSLINSLSAQRTSTHPSAQKLQPVIAFGVRRIYNYVMSDRAAQVYGPGIPFHRRGVLNVRATDAATDFFNGVRLTLTRSDLEAFRLREYGYDLIPILTVPWHNPTAPPQQAYCFSCRLPERNGRIMLSEQIQPHPGYHLLCELGCSQISPEFLQFFRYSTWVTDHAPQSLILAGQSADELS